MAESPKLGLFEAVGIELEYMIVDRYRLDVLPACDRVLAAEAGHITSDVEFDDLSWSNELVSHLIELKTTRPASRFDDLAPIFQRHVGRINRLLEPLSGRLLPTAMHPWMKPWEETHLWPHDSNAVYETFHRIFDCRGHGWSNLQSMHVNLPFRNDEEFGRLHAAIRLLLPILPALAASSPIIDGRVTGLLDNRLQAYRQNCARIPHITGRVVPEPVFTADQYREQILEPIYRDLAPHDPEGTLQDEWANARGAIARFCRNTIEIRLIDIQECPAVDLAIAATTFEVLRLLVCETWCDLRDQQAWPTEPLAALLEATILAGEAAPIDNTAYLRALGWDSSSSCTAGQLWSHLVDAVRTRSPQALGFAEKEIRALLEHGPLGRRILRRTGACPAPGLLVEVYRELADCLAAGRMLVP